MRLTLPKYILSMQKAEKAKTVQVRAYTRQGKPVKPHSRTVEGAAGARKVDFMVLRDINEDIEKNIAYLVYMAKVISTGHGIPIQFHDGQPVGDTADLFAEGRMGMLVGGMEWEGKKEKKVKRIVQMKTRAKLNMLKMAKKLSSQIKRPRDFHIHRRIINDMVDKLTHKSGGYPPMPEDVAENITLMKRTRGRRKELSFKEKLHKVYEIARYGSRFLMDIDWEIAGDQDEEMWKKSSPEERQLQKEVRGVLSGLVTNRDLTQEQYDILRKRYYLGKKLLPRQPRSFQRVADMIWDENKPRRVRKKVGDYYRHTPTSKKGKKYKFPVYAKIIKVAKKPSPHFWVKVGKTRRRIIGLPPFRKRVKTPTVHQVIEKHAEAVEIIKPHLEHLIPLLKKSVERNRIAQWIGKDIRLFSN